jgi:kumamolisin
MKHRIASCAIAATVLAVGFRGTAYGQNGYRGGRVIVPQSSIEQLEDIGLRAHTHVLLLQPAGSALPQSGPPFSGLIAETPASLACIYRLAAFVAGCNQDTVTANPTGGFGAIAIVDAYDDPDAATDLANFSKQFGLPAPSFQVVFASGARPPQDSTGGWELEESLDIEWAHAMAPHAKIYLVEAHSNSFTDLFTAVHKANSLVAAAGGGEVSMSWGGGEFSGENSYDSYFTTSGIVYFAAAGDTVGQVEYPSASPNVVSAGGTSISRNANTGNFEAESAWYSTGGGPSAYEPTPSYQSGISGLTGARGTPDISFDSDPNTPVWVLDSIPYEGQGGPGSWWLVGGTSLACQALAGIVNSAGSKHASTNAELTEIYANMKSTSDFHDITKGICGTYMSYLAQKGYDFCTGVGSDVGKTGK